MQILIHTGVSPQQFPEGCNIKRYFKINDFSTGASKIKAIIELPYDFRILTSNV